MMNLAVVLYLEMLLTAGPLHLTAELKIVLDWILTFYLFVIKKKHLFVDLQCC